MLQTRVRPILLSGIRYRSILASNGRYRYQPILIWVLAPIPVVLSFVYLSQQSTLLQRTPVVSSLYRIFVHIYCAYIYNLHIPIPRTKSHFQYRKIAQPSIGIGIAAADSIGYRVPARYQSNPTSDSKEHQRHNSHVAYWEQWYVTFHTVISVIVTSLILLSDTWAVQYSNDKSTIHRRPSLAKRQRRHITMWSADGQCWAICVCYVKQCHCLGL